jgi:phage terminase large subunit
MIPQTASPEEDYDDFPEESSEPARELRIRTPRAFLPLLQPARYKAAWGGRGSGKSHFFAESLIERCLMNRTRAVCIREVQKSLGQSVKLLLDDKIKEWGLESDDERPGTFRILNNYIAAPYGGAIIFNGMQDHTAESIKSLEGYDIAWVEEAQSLSQRSLDLLRPTIRKNTSEIWFSWNPRRPTDPVDQFLRGAGAPNDAIVVQVNWLDNPFLPSVLAKEVAWDQARDPDKYAHVWLGEYERNSELRVFKNWRVEEFETPADSMFMYGADWGFTIDPSVLVRCYVGVTETKLDGQVQYGRTLFIDQEAYEVGVEIDYLGDLFDRVPDSKKWRITADSARPETISYMKRHGFPKMDSAVKGANSVKEGVMFLQNFDIVVHPRCKHTIDELSLYSFKVDQLTGRPTPVLQDKKNHVIDSLRYAVEDLRSGRFTPREAGLSSSATW